MPYYTRDEDEVDDFDEFDPTPYSGGYDITVIYGRPIPPCDDTCYPLSSAADEDFEYERPEFTSYHDPSAYAEEALNTEYSSYSRPKPRPGFRPGSAGGGHVQGERPDPSYGSGYGGATEAEYGRRPESGYGGRSETETGYGSGYEKKPSFGEERSEYERKPSYGRSGEEEGGYRKPSYGRSEDQVESYIKPTSYERSEEQEEGSYRKPSYGRNDDDDDEERRNRSGDDEEGSYGRKKYGGNNSNDDDEEKKQHRYKHHHHQRRRDEDDD
ncbi:unnamed protein product [Brassica napus]|uniref:(rape) hypothetical protein n=1 Tax=Brassica napus TaxID=3708 RepID=A0A816IVV5_BRANA|nr:unnamed protein product [Brassica napus]